MVQNSKSFWTDPSGTVQERGGTETKPPEVAALLGKVARHLQDGEPGKALDALTRARLQSPWVTNAQGVCRLRLGEAALAVDVFRGLVLSGSVVLRPDVPAVFKTNYATALLASSNVSGCRLVLDEIRDEGNPAVQKLRAAMRRWYDGLATWQKVQWYFGGQPHRQPELDFPPGDLE
jgi:hypothetical protein